MRGVRAVPRKRPRTGVREDSLTVALSRLDGIYKM
jgi:hypothetical protein